MIRNSETHTVDFVRRDERATVMLHTYNTCIRSILDVQLGMHLMRCVSTCYLVGALSRTILLYYYTYPTLANVNEKITYTTERSKIFTYAQGVFLVKTKNDQNKIIIPLEFSCVVNDLLITKRRPIGG